MCVCPGVLQPAVGPLGGSIGIKKNYKEEDQHSKVTMLHSGNASLITETLGTPKQAYGLLLATGCRLAHALNFDARTSHYKKNL